MLPLTVEETTSISGASPLTVTVSCSVAGPICSATAACWPTSSCRPARVTVPNPASSAVSRYVPIRSGIRNAPAPSLTARNVLPEASFVAVMVTPGSTPPCVSLTVPLSVASCAAAANGSASMTSDVSTRTSSFVFIDGARGKRQAMRASARR